MALNVNQIAAVIKQQIATYDQKLKLHQRGTVVMVGDGVALVSGLENVMLGELVTIAGATTGLVLSLEEEIFGVALMANNHRIKEGDLVVRTKQLASIRVGDELLGRIISPTGKFLDGEPPVTITKSRPLERVAPGVMARQSVSRPLQTGIMVIDGLFPIGMGQRELIIGDREIGKTALAVDTIINQRGKDVLCVYVAIGQKASSIAAITEKLKTTGALEHTTVVVATASDQPTIQYLAPYAGIAIAEEWMAAGKNVLIVYDDLSKHAVAYRTLSLLLRRPPGREAYPGDIFYLHSRLLERACCLSDQQGGGTITALPIVETQIGDISAYIPTNVISITDGQIFLNLDQFNLGLRPAVDVGLSVSRVGSAAQFNFMKQVSGGLKLALAQYRELAAFSQFSADLDVHTKQKLDQGAKITAILCQEQYAPYDQFDQAVIMLAVKERLIQWVPLSHIDNFKKAIISHFNERRVNQRLRQQLLTTQRLTPALLKRIVTQIKAIVWRLIEKTTDYHYQHYGTTTEWNQFKTSVNQLVPPPKT